MRLLTSLGHVVPITQEDLERDTNGEKQARPLLPAEDLGQIECRMTGTEFSNFSQQYSGLYFRRLAKLRSKCLQQAATMWPFLPKNSHVGRMSHLATSMSALGEEAEVVVVGTLCRIARGRALAIQEFKATSMVSDQPMAHLLCTDATVTPSYRLDPVEDYYCLEDEGYRVRVEGLSEKAAQGLSKLPTGTVIALKGRGSGERNAEIFKFSDWCFPLMTAPPELRAMHDGPCYLAIVSGLFVGDPLNSVSYLRPRLLSQLEDYLLNVNPSVCRLILAGNTFGVHHDLLEPRRIGALEGSDGMDDRHLNDSSKYLSTVGHGKVDSGLFGCFFSDAKCAENEDPNGHSLDSGNFSGSLSRYLSEVHLQSAKVVDRLIVKLSESGLPVDLVPGPTDPTNFCLPQQPLHPSFFQNAKVYKSFRSTTNPVKMSVGEGDAKVLVSGSAGQCTADIIAHTNLQDPLDALELCVKSQLIAPTAPDTLPAYPNASTGKHDPFLLGLQGSTPHLLFSGNSGLSVGKRLVNKVLCVSVPSLAVSGELCLIDVSSSLKEKSVLTVKLDESKVPTKQ